MRLVIFRGGFSYVTISATRCRDVIHPVVHRPQEASLRMNFTRSRCVTSFGLRPFRAIS